MAKLSNPFAFRRGPVTIIISAIYTALITTLVVIHVTVPTVPLELPRGVNITEAWLDLQHLAASHHPYNSRANDHVRDWLLLRIESILAENNATAATATSLKPAYVFSDMTSNLTFSSGASSSHPERRLSVYFEGTNIIVYIRGTEDDKVEWWNEAKGNPKSAGVLVNAHYDSVSTGFGATDDGVGVVSVLQLIRYYTTPGNRPRKGLVALLNNAEEDFLLGAHVFSQHPMSQFPHTFLNLEGAGAGGRATLFRSTDTEVTRAYKSVAHPLGSVLSQDGFEMGLIRSQTDYVVFHGILGLRGLDVAFFEPRARYHTSQDDTKHTSTKSLWHMLSAALNTTKYLTSSPGSSFTGKPAVKDGVRAGTGTLAVWFDMFGRGFALFQLHTLFALSVTMLVAAPILLIVTMLVLQNADKFYLFSGSKSIRTPDGEEIVPLYGWRGFFRFPVVFLLSCAAPVALAYLIFKENPYIAHSSEWSVWSMMLSSFLFIAWFCCRAADSVRPSALTRAYCFLWMFAAWWAILVASVVFETRLKIAGGYFVWFFFASVSLATWVSLLELSALPKKSSYGQDKYNESIAASQSASQRQPLHGVGTYNEGDDTVGEVPTERTTLLPGKKQRTFAHYYRVFDNEPAPAERGEEDKESYPEQEWSKKLPGWTWLLQFVLLAPTIVIVGQIALFFMSGLHQTGQDGSSMFMVYIFTATFAIIILSPLVPFLHRFTWQAPMFLLLVLIGTSIYNSTAFPFSPNNRLKLFFIQEVDLDSGINTASLTGVTPYLQQAIETLPSAAGQPLDCSDSMRGGLTKCSWNGLAPRVVDSDSTLPPESQYRSWLSFNVSRAAHGNSARFTLFGRKTRACKILLDSPVSEVSVLGSAPRDPRYPPVPEGGSREIRLWSRKWENAWTVDLKWDDPSEFEPRDSGMKGRVVCLWSEANDVGVIPALDEVKHFAPDWVALAKDDDGLVEGYKRFLI